MNIVPAPPPDTDSSALADAWKHSLDAAGADAGQILESLADAHAAELAAHFYKVMMNDARASRSMSHDQVRVRLQPAMQRWVKDLLRATPADVEQLIANQRVIGDVHARVGIPVDLVTRGTRVLKQRLFQLIGEQAGLAKPRTPPSPASPPRSISRWRV